MQPEKETQSAVSATVETALPFIASRAVPPQAAMEFATVLANSNAVDDFQSVDQLVSWTTRQLWTPDVTPMANTLSDPDSFADAFVLAAYSTAATRKLGLSISTDAIRRGPAEILQTLLTLAGATDGRCAITLGAGELKQAKPFGYKRSEGLKRLEDHLRIYRKLLDSSEPIDFDGHFWTYRNAWIGAGKLKTPEIWTMGGGPQLSDLSAKYADGWTTAVPNAFHDPESYGREVQRIKSLLEQNGRDPEQFTFGIWAAVMLHDDPDVIERAYSNRLVKYMASSIGRLNQADWEAVGITPVYPRDWHYALKLLPAQETADNVDSVVSRTPVEMSRRGWFWGSADKVASEILQFVEAGATWVSVGDMMPLLQPAEEAGASLQRQIECCRLLKAAT